MNIQDTVFIRPLSPQTLIDRAYSSVGYSGEQASDHDLVIAYRYSMFVNTLLRYWNLRFYSWSCRDNIYLGQIGAMDRIQSLRAELQKRRLFDFADNGYCINFLEIQNFIKKKDHEKFNN